MKVTNLSLTNSLIFAIISGLLIIPLSYLEGFGLPYILGVSIIDILIGTVFALLVMAPFQKHLNVFRILLMILASISIYTGVAHLAITRYELLQLNLTHTPSIILSGGLGALLTGVAVHLFAPIKPSNSTYPILIIAGLIAGFVFSYTIQSSNVFINSIGFITWQVMVSYAIFTTKK